MRRAVLTIVVLLGVTSCAWTGDSTTPNAAAEAGAADATNVLGARWEPLRHPRFADEFIVDRCGNPAFGESLVAAVNAYLDNDPDADTVPRSTVDSFDTKSAPFAAGNEALLTGSLFSEEVLGGFDNSHTTVLFVGRSGPVVVTALAASNAQNPDPDNPSSLARRLGVSALARATAG